MSKSTFPVLTAATNPYATNESSYAILVEGTWLQGNLLSNIFYGMVLILFVMCFSILVRNMNRSNRKRQSVLLIYITLIFGMSTIFMITNALIIQHAFIEYRNFPGGPGQYIAYTFADSVGTASNVSWALGNWMMDAFLLWRFLVVYGDLRRSWLVVLIATPCLMLLASIVLGIIIFHDMALVGDTANSLPTAFPQLMLAYYVMSLALNVIATILISVRLLVYRYQIKKVLGAHHAVGYANTAAVISESAVIYSSFALTYLVSFGVNSPAQNILINQVNLIQVLSTYLIIYRVATGKAWTEDTSTRMFESNTNSVHQVNPSTIQFAPNDPSPSTGSLSVYNKERSTVITGQSDDEKGM